MRHCLAGGGHPLFLFHFLLLLIVITQFYFVTCYCYLVDPLIFKYINKGSNSNFK